MKYVGKLMALGIEADSKPIVVAEIESGISSLALAEDGNTVAIASIDRKMKVFRTKDWSEIALPNYDGGDRPPDVKSVALSTSAKFLCFVTKGGHLGAIDVSHKKLMYYENRLDRDNQAIAAAPDSDSRFWVGTTEGVLRRLDCVGVQVEDMIVEEFQIVDVQAVFEAPVVALADSGGGKIVASNYEHELAVLDTRKADSLAIKKIAQNETMHFLAIDDLVVCGESGKMTIRDAGTGEAWKSVSVRQSIFTSIGVAKKKGIVAAATAMGDIVVGKVVK